MLINTIIPVVMLMTIQGLPSELGINYLPLESNGLNLALSPTMLGEKPKLILKSKTQIAGLLADLTKTKTNKTISPQFVHFVFRFEGKTIYVDCDGVVQGFGQNYLVDPKLLEKRILNIGFPPKEPNKAILPEW